MRYAIRITTESFFMRHHIKPSVIVIAVGMLVTLHAGAQERSLDPVVVSASRIEMRLYDTPAAVSRVDTDWRGDGAPATGLTDALLAVPGMAVRERNNFAQDVQLSIRGFGSRATFGVRGSRILVDGIPASMPDGQGQLSTATLSSARHIEVLRGPWAQMYGNVGGGVLMVESAPAPAMPEAAMRLAAGSDGFRQALLSGGTRLQSGLGIQADASTFSTDGARTHASAERHYLDLRFDLASDDRTKVRFGINGFSQPATQDPLGLTRTEFGRDPRVVNPLAEQFNTRKNIDQVQLGVQAEHAINTLDKLAVVAYAGQRDLRQYLAFSGAAANSAGGVVDLDRTYYGTGVAWHHRFRTSDQIPMRWSIGADVEAMRDRRLGFVNANGSEGALRRDEDNDATATGVYGQMAAYVRPDVLLSAGARYSEVRIRVDDRYITTASPDDSGRVSYSKFSPVAGVQWHATETVNTFVNFGYGFETPTLSEIAYRPNGSGLNLSLQPARSRHLEAGMKFRRDDLALQATVFRSETDGEIVPLSNQGGRTTFRNVDGVERYGLELGAQVAWRQVQWRLAYTLLQAQFTQAFNSASGAPVNAGNRLPGTARHAFNLEAAWKPTDELRLGAVLHGESRIHVDDLNSEAAPGYVTLGFHVDRAFRFGRSQANVFFRADNLFDRTYAGSVIVNEGNRRFYETAAGRTLIAGVKISL